MGKKKDDLLMPEIKSYDPVTKKSDIIKGGKGKKSRAITHKGVEFNDLSKNMESDVSKVCGKGIVDDMVDIKLKK